MSKKKVVVEEYNPLWAEEFNKLKTVFENHLGDLFISIEHVGSTSVKGLAAKPIIDLDIVIEDGEKILQQVIQKLEKLGYRHRGDLGIIGREAFKRDSQKVPFDGSDRKWMYHHLYVCIKDCVSLLNHLNLRDYLRENESSRNEYGKLKLELAEKFPNDIDSYIEGKTNFIINILEKFDLETNELETIREQNKNKK